MDIAQSLLSGVAIILSLLALWWSRRTQRVQIYDSMVNAFERMNTLALDDDRNLRVVYELHFPDEPCDDPARIRKHWLCYSVLNALELTLVAQQHHAISERAAHRILKRLPAIARDPEVQRIIKAGTYTPEFTKRITDCMPDALQSRRPAEDETPNKTIDSHEE